MACNKPFKAYLKDGGGITADPAHSINGMLQEFPCKKCLGCRKQYASHWATRNMFENSEHTESCFITATYDDENLPQYGSLSRTDPSDFIKAIRNHFNRDRVRLGLDPILIRFFQGSEYSNPNEEAKLDGKKFGRPHSHYLLYGANFNDREPWSENEGIMTYTSDILEKLWGKGFTTLGEVNQHTCMYTASYIYKKQYGSHAPDHYKETNIYTGDVIDMAPEFTSMSRMPGLGFQHFDKWKSDYFPSNFMIRDGYKIAIPPYFVDKLLDIKGKTSNQVATDLEMHAEIKIKNRLERKKRHIDNTPERLVVKERILKIANKKQNRGAQQL